MKRPNLKLGAAPKTEHGKKPQNALDVIGDLYQRGIKPTQIVVDPETRLASFVYHDGNAERLLKHCKLDGRKIRQKAILSNQPGCSIALFQQFYGPFFEGLVCFFYGFSRTHVAGINANGFMVVLAAPAGAKTAGGEKRWRKEAHARLDAMSDAIGATLNGCWVVRE